MTSNIFHIRSCMHILKWMTDRRMSLQWPRPVMMYVMNTHRHLHTANKAKTPPLPTEALYNLQPGKAQDASDDTPKSPAMTLLHLRIESKHCLISPWRFHNELSLWFDRIHCATCYQWVETKSCPCILVSSKSEKKLSKLTSTLSKRGTSSLSTNEAQYSSTPTGGLNGNVSSRFVGLSTIACNTVGPVIIEFC